MYWEYARSSYAPTFDVGSCAGLHTMENHAVLNMGTDKDLELCSKEQSIARVVERVYACTCNARHLHVCQLLQVGSLVPNVLGEEIVQFVFTWLQRLNARFTWIHWHKGSWCSTRSRKMRRCRRVVWDLLLVLFLPLFRIRMFEQKHNVITGILIEHPVQCRRLNT